MWPLGARAQQTMPVVGFLSSRSPVLFETISDLVAEAKTQFAILLDERFGTA